MSNYIWEYSHEKVASPVFRNACQQQLWWESSEQNKFFDDPACPFHINCYEERARFSLYHKHAFLCQLNFFFTWFVVDKLQWEPLCLFGGSHLCKSDFCTHTKLFNDFELFEH